MPSILADGNVEGHLKALVRVLENTDWQEIWASLDVGVVTFDHLGVARDVSDRILWRACQQQNVILITGNRNAAGADSLEATIRLENTDSCLLVLTIANPARIYTDRGLPTLNMPRSDYWRCSWTLTPCVEPDAFTSRSAQKFLSSACFFPAGALAETRQAQIP